MWHTRPASSNFRVWALLALSIYTGTIPWAVWRHSTSNENRKASFQSWKHMQKPEVLLVLSSLQGVSFLTRLIRIGGGGLHYSDAATKAWKEGCGLSGELRWFQEESDFPIFRLSHGTILSLRPVLPYLTVSIHGEQCLRLSRCLGKSSEQSLCFCRWTVILGGLERAATLPPETHQYQPGRWLSGVCARGYVHVCWARKWHVLGGACREALGWIPTLAWLCFHTSFPCRPGEARLHRWPSGWHFRTRPSAHSQPYPPFHLCFTGSMDSERSAGRGWRGNGGDGQRDYVQD